MPIDPFIVVGVTSGAVGIGSGIFGGLVLARKGMVSKDSCDTCKEMTGTRLTEIKTEQGIQRTMLTSIARDVNVLVGFHKKEGGDG